MLKKSNLLFFLISIDCAMNNGLSIHLLVKDSPKKKKEEEKEKEKENRKAEIKDFSRKKKKKDESI